ncbi:DUF3147 family protein [Sphingomonas sp. ASV193]|uniref:DUF3147 family protein n=1 Tax=Sphingomonas sp. ASV193 TaxID=3144405 RepID=UPI0032E8E0A9
MFGFLAKAAFSGLTVALVTVVAKRHPGWGGLLASLPLTSLLAISLLWVDTRDPAKVGQLSTGIALFILPSLPLFFVLPGLMRAGVGFWIALGMSVALTLALYALFFWAMPRLGVKL